MATTRIRRGKVVDIPEEWQGVVTYKQTIHKRQSKKGRKQRMNIGGDDMYNTHGHPRNKSPRHIPGARSVDVDYFEEA